MSKNDIKQLELLDAQILGYTIAKSEAGLADLLIEAGVETLAELNEYKKHFDLLPETDEIIKNEIQRLEELLEARKRDYEHFGMTADDAEVDNHIRYKIRLLKELIK